jgi:hypothetical protein
MQKWGRWGVAYALNGYWVQSRARIRYSTLLPMPKEVTRHWAGSVSLPRQKMAGTVCPCSESVNRE